MLFRMPWPQRQKTWQRRHSYPQCTHKAPCDKLSLRKWNLQVEGNQEVGWCQGAELNRRHTDFQFRSWILPKLTNPNQLNALYPIWQVGTPAKSYQLLTRELGGNQEA